MMKRLILAGLLSVVLVCPAATHGAQLPWETIEWQRMSVVEKFEWAVTLFRMGRAADAGESLKLVVAANPTPRDLVEMANKLSPVLRDRMILDPATQEGMKEFAKLAEDAVIKLRRDDGYIKELVGKLTGDLAGQRVAITRLVEMGEYAAPEVIKLMAQSQNTEHQKVAYVLLLGMGRSAVLPAVECLSSSDAGVKMMVLKLLGDLQDVRAIARISAVAADEKTPAGIRKAAKDALDRIRRQPMPALPIEKDPAVNYWNLANACLHEKEVVLPALGGKELPIWTWSTEAGWVTCKLVPARLYNEKLAQEACYDGLALRKNDVKLQSLLISAYSAEKLEHLGHDTPKLKRALDLAILVGGKKALRMSLSKALADGMDGIAIQAAQALREVGAGKGFTNEEGSKATNPLLRALEDDSRAVRFAAARAVVAAQPAGSRDARDGAFDNIERVLPALSWGLLYDMNERTVLIVAPETGLVNHCKAAVEKLGHKTLEATDLKTGLTLAGSLPTPDALILSSKFAVDLARFKSALDSKPALILLLGTGDEKDALEAEYLKSGRVNAVLLERPGDDAVKLTLEGIARVPEKELTAMLVPDISARAAESLAAIVPGATPLSTSEVVPALRRALASPNDAVRIPTLRTLGNIAADEATLDVLVVAEAASKASKPVRLAALRALRKTLEVQDEVQPDVFEKLVPISGESDPEIALAAAKAITVAKFDPAKFTDLLVLKRVREIRSGG